MKLFEEFKLYEHLWEDTASEPSKNEYQISYEDKVFDLSTEEGLQDYITLRAPKLGKKAVRVDVAQIIGHDKEPNSAEYTKAKGELTDLLGKLAAVDALFKLPARTQSEILAQYKLRKRLNKLRDDLKRQYETARKNLQSAAGTQGTASAHTKASCMWTTPDGREIDLNYIPDVNKEIDFLVQLLKKYWSGHSDARVADGKPAIKNISKILENERKVLTFEFDSLRDAINSASATKKAMQEKSLGRYYSVVDYLHEEFKLYENMWEALKEELASKKLLKEASQSDQSKRLKRAAIVYLIEHGKKNIAQLLNQFDFVITDTIAPGTIEITGGVLNIHTDLANGPFNAMLAAIAQAVKSNNNGTSKTTTPRYVIASKYNPTISDIAFYQFDSGLFDFKLVDLASATVENSLGDARFTANNILSMSDLHRIYILDADTLAEVDSLDYYNDYEDENDYPGYFDAP